MKIINKQTVLSQDERPEAKELMWPSVYVFFKAWIWTWQNSLKHQIDAGENKPFKPSLWRHQRARAVIKADVKKPTSLAAMFPWCLNVVLVLNGSSLRFSLDYPWFNTHTVIFVWTSSFTEYQLEFRIKNCSSFSDVWPFSSCHSLDSLNSLKVVLHLRMTKDWR